MSCERYEVINAAKTSVDQQKLYFHEIIDIDP